MEQPPLVTRALALAAHIGFERSCEAEAGALLHVLAARRGILRVAEIGAGAGVGSAWIVSALPPSTPFFTAEIDPGRATAVASLFADDQNVTVLVGSWRETLHAEAPFDFLFVDATDAKDDVDATIGLLAPGGTAILDDFSFDVLARDARRDSWLHHRSLSAVEVWVAPSRRALVAVRL